MLAHRRLNQSQIAAVEHDNGPLVVFAGAGSGKTMVITHRVARLVRVKGVPPWRILAVTFTNKAAAVMRERLSLLLEAGAEELWIGTFHATCARLLRRYSEACGIRRDFIIYDEADQRALLKRLLKQHKLDERVYSPKSLAWHINHAKQEGIDVQQFESGTSFDRVIKQIYIYYEEQLEKAGALDFGDLIFRLVRALRQDATLLREIQRRYDHVLVDEFQDTNRVQFQLVHDLCKVHRNLCVVGDDDQSIYRWRGADRRNILDFSRHFTDAKLIKLEQNYRSTKRILKAANAVIAHNIDRKAKTLWTQNAEGQAVTLVCCADERHEALSFVATIKELVAEGLSRSDIALLYRVHAQSRVFEEALRAANLPYRVLGGMRFYERAEIKDFLAYLRVIHNPDDDVSLLRIINTPPRGIGKTTIDRLLNSAAQRGSSLWESANQASTQSALGTAGRKKLSGFLELMDCLRQMNTNGIDPASLAKAVLDKTGYMKVLETADSAEADAKIDNIRELIGSIDEYEKTVKTPTLESFLESVTLQTDADRTIDEEAITLMTIHAAKGLEFSAVVVAGMEEGMFPHFVNDEMEDEQDQLEEERRLAYVAFTRARERLILTHTLVRNIYGETRGCRPSRFINEIPRSELRRIDDVSQNRFGNDFYQTNKRSWGRNAIQEPIRRDPRLPAIAKGDSYVDLSEGSEIDSGFFLGMRVNHKTFGLGKIDGLCPENPASVIVDFKSCGKKKIKANFLKPI
ncbi:MAG: UvrD-helicase domain-containing protein [Deltaproteobacteria bacterium]|nr:UvrD-helicase domain-containing protein [Deltaproteobacteria bacterium]